MLRDDPVFRRILKNSGWLLSAKGLSLPLQVAQSVLVARLLGIDQFGVLGIVIAFAVTAHRLTSFRMNELVVKYVTDALAARRNDQAAAVIKVALLAEVTTSLIAFGVALLAAPFAARWFIGDAAAATFITTYALSMLIDAVLESATGILQVFDRFRFQALAEVAGRVLTLGAVAVVYALDGGLPEVIAAYLVGNLLSTGAVVLGALHVTASQLGATWWRTPLRTLRGQGRAMTGFAVSTNIGATLSLIVKDSELLWLGLLSTPAAVGFYKLAKSWVGMVVIPAGPMTKAFYPEIARTIAAGNLTATRQLLRKGTVIAAAWVLPIGLGFLALSPWFVPALYGTEFKPAIAAFALLMLGIGLADIVFWTRPALLSLGRPDVAVRITLLHTVLKVTLVLAFVPDGGHVVMAGITGGLYILGACISTMFVIHNLRHHHGPAAAEPLGEAR